MPRRRQNQQSMSRDWLFYHEQQLSLHDWRDYQAWRPPKPTLPKPEESERGIISSFFQGAIRGLLIGGLLRYSWKGVLCTAGIIGLLAYTREIQIDWIKGGKNTKETCKSFGFSGFLGGLIGMLWALQADEANMQGMPETTDQLPLWSPSRLKPV